jgi:uroporphyrin-III C-methyltransferase
MSGKVYLIGAGPGDPELLTRKAWRLIQSADAVLHDELVSPEILALVPPFARVFSVGKRCRRRVVTQEEINTLMVACAQSGLTVVRLKGGDPLIFGRIGEEIDALREAEVEFEIVPGVTAACAAAAAARVPLTDRRFASELVFVPGHLASGKSAQAAWERLSPNATVVVYMPGADYARLSAQLVEAGLSPETPCMIVSRASAPDEQRLLTTLEGLPEVSPGASPSLLIVGAVAALGSDAPGKPVHNAFIESFNVGNVWCYVRWTPRHKKEKGLPCLPVAQ